MDFKERHKKYCKVENCPVCKKLDNMPDKKEKSKLLVLLPPDGRGSKAQPKYVIASTERLWNQASEYQRLNALETSVTKDLEPEFISMSKLTWEKLPMWTLRKHLNQTTIVDRILAGMTEEEWNDFRKKHIILSQEPSNLFRDDD